MAEITAPPLQIGRLLTALGTITADTKVLESTVTWNDAGVTFVAWKLNVTSTASAAASLLADLQTGGVSQFKVSKAGVCTASTSFVATTLTGTLSTAAQPNVTSVGTLTGLTTGTLSVTSTATFSDNVGMGVAPDQAVALYLSGTVTAGATQYGLLATPTVSSAATTAAIAINARVDTTAAAYTVTSAYGLYIANPSKGAGSAITNNYGLYVESPTAGGTLNRAIFVAGGTSEFGGAVTMGSGLTVSAGTTAVQALTASGLLTVTSANIRLSNAFNLTGNDTGGTAQHLISMNASDFVTIDAGGFGANFGGGILTASPSGVTGRRWKLGEAHSVSPTSPNRTVSIDVNGTVYYLHAKTTND